jgi:hypothetical protein
MPQKSRNLMIPTELKMEDLSGLKKLQPTLILNLVFAQGDMDISRSTALNRRLYIRLLDKTLDEYKEARDLIIDQITEGQRNPEEMTQNGRYIYMFKFIDHMENCISSVRRIVRFLEILKGNQDGLAFPRIVRKHIESLATSIIDVRNIIEHMDEKIQNDVIQENEPVMLKIMDTQDGIVIAGHSLRFSTMSTLIKMLYVLGQSMAGWRLIDDKNRQHA